jgi:hypothetical protein
MLHQYSPEFNRGKRVSAPQKNIYASHLLELTTSPGPRLENKMEAGGRQNYLLRTTAWHSQAKGTACFRIGQCQRDDNEMMSKYTSYHSLPCGHISGFVCLIPMSLWRGGPLCRHGLHRGQPGVHPAPTPVTTPKL